MRTFAAWVAVGVLAGACESSPPEVQPLYVEGFGRLCVAASDCSGGAKCFTFTGGNRRCTVPCKFDAECPVGDHGRKCDPQGYCLP